MSFIRDFIGQLSPEQWTAVSTVALAIATLLLGFVAYLQIRTTRAQLRAYIVVGTNDGQGLIITQGKGLRFEARPNILNSGQTPATGVRVSSRMMVSEASLPADFDFTLPDINPEATFTLGPQQSRFPSIIMDNRLSRSELRELLSRDKTLFVYGTVRYRDIFRRKQFTNLAYTAIARKNGSSLWRSVVKHNDSS
jgi:hypothetical protein